MPAPSSLGTATHPELLPRALSLASAPRTVGAPRLASACGDVGDFLGIVPPVQVLDLGRGGQ